MLIKKLPKLGDIILPETIKDYVKLGGIVYTTTPRKFNLLGIGTCLGIYLYDLKKYHYTMAHSILPTFNQREDRVNAKMPGKFTDIAIMKMIKFLVKKDSVKSDIKCKIVGGSQIYNDSFNVGEKNIITARKILKVENIPLVKEDTGGKLSRSILSYNVNGTMEVRKQGIIYNI
jgi:chemotaxis protein CheD